MVSHNSLLQSALAYAHAGFRVFPCKPEAKEPVPGLKWVQKATTSETILQGWWLETPRANVGIAADDWLILDIDRKPRKPNGFETLADVLPLLPRTFTVQTPNLGEHRYFRKPPGWQPAQQRGRGFDVQTGNAYVLAPPSRVQMGFYVGEYVVTDGSPIQPLPGCLESFLGQVADRPVAEPDAGAPPLLTGAELEACWPDVSGWPDRLRAWWDEGRVQEYDTQSEAIHGLAWQLYQASLTAQQVLSVMWEHGWTQNVALAHRQGQALKAVEYLWSSCVKLQSSRRPSAREVFEVQAGERVEDLYARLYARVQALDVPNTPETLRELAAVLAEGQVLSEVARALLSTTIADKNLGMTRKQAEAVLSPPKSKKRGPQGSGSTVPELSSLKDHVWVGPLNRFYNLKTDAYVQHSALVHQYTHLASENQTPAQVVEELIANDQNVAEGLTYRPDQAPGRLMERGRLVWNTATPVAVERVDGDIQPYLDLFGRMKIAEADRERILDYFAWMLQKPGERIRHALAIGGKETGTGKDTILEPMRQILTPRHHLEIRGEDLFSDFTGHLMGKRLVTVQETATPDLKEARNLERRISPLISQDLITIHPKGVDRYQAPNFLQIVVTTNEERPLHLSPEDRRFDMVKVMLKYTSEVERHQWDDYWKWIHNWYTQWSGVNIVYTYLMDRDMSHYNPNRAPPRTVWHQEVVRGSRFEAEEIVYEAIDARVGVFKLPIFEAAHALATARAFFPGEMENGRRIGQKQVTNALSRLGYRKHEVAKGSRRLRDKRYLWAKDEDWERVGEGKSGEQVINWYDEEMERQTKDTVESNVRPLFLGAGN